MVRNFSTYLQAPQVVYGRIFGGDTACGDKRFTVHFMRRLSGWRFLVRFKGKIRQTRDRRLFAGLERPCPAVYASDPVIYIELVLPCLFRLIPQAAVLRSLPLRLERLKEICLIYAWAMRRRWQGCRRPLRPYPQATPPMTSWPKAGPGG